MKSGTRSKRRTLNASVTFIKGSPIKVTIMSTSGHQSQTSHFSNQLLNNQSLHRHPLLQPLPNSKSFHWHLSPQQPLLRCQFRSLSSHLLRDRLHRVAKSVPGFRPFQMKTKTIRRSRKEQNFKAHPPPPLHQTNLTPLPIHQLEIHEDKYDPDLAVKIFHQLLDIWPSHRMQIFKNAEMIYRLTREEKEQVKFLGLQNLFNTSRPRRDLHRKEPGRWKKS